MTPNRVRLADVAQARSGDKADLANVALFAPSDELYAAFLREVASDRVREHFGRFVRGGVDRYEVPNVRALNFVLHRALGGGASRSLRSDRKSSSLPSGHTRARSTGRSRKRTPVTRS